MLVRFAQSQHLKQPPPSQQEQGRFHPIILQACPPQALLLSGCMLFALRLKMQNIKWSSKIIVLLCSSPKNVFLPHKQQGKHAKKAHRFYLQ